MSRQPTPRDFPVLWTPKRWRKFHRGRPYAVCSCCHLAVDPRNRARHVRACNNRKRLAPQMWAEWRADMRERNA